MAESNLFLQNALNPFRSRGGSPSMSALRKPVQRVLVIGSGALFDEGIAHRLASNLKLQVLRRKYVDEAAFITDVQFILPNIIILNEYDPLELEHLIKVLPVAACSAHLRVLVLRLYSSWIEVYDRTGQQKTGLMKFRQQALDISRWDELVDLVCRDD